MSVCLHRFLFLLAALAVVATSAASAQQSADPESTQGGAPQQGVGRRGAYGSGPRQHTEMLARKLNLTDAQRRQFLEINEHTRQQVTSIHNDSTLTAEQKKEKIQALRKQAHQDMFAVLTPEQKEQLKQMREQMQKQRESKKGPGDQASSKKNADDDDPFAGMTSDDDDGPITKAP